MPITEINLKKKAKIVVFGGPRGVRNGTFPTFYNDLTKKTRGPKKGRFSEANMGQI